MLAPFVRGARYYPACYQRPLHCFRSLSRLPLNLDIRVSSHHPLCRAVRHLATAATGAEENAREGNTWTNEARSEHHDRRSNVGTQKHLQLGRLRNRRSGKTFTAKSTPLPVQSFGKPAEVLVINRERTNIVREEEEEKHAGEHEIEQGRLDDADIAVQAEPSHDNAEDIAARIIESIQVRDEPLTDQQQDLTFNEDINNLRPFAGNDGEVHLSGEEYHKLLKSLKDGFTLRQLETYHKTHTSNRAREEPATIKKFSSNWTVLSQDPLQRQKNRSKRRTNSQKKSKFVLAIVRDLWKVHSAAEDVSTVAIKGVVSVDCARLLYAGGVSIAHEMFKTWGVRLAIQKANSKSKVDDEINIAISDKVLSITLTGTYLGVLASSQKIDLIKASPDSNSEIININHLHKTNKLWPVFKPKDHLLFNTHLAQALSQARAIVVPMTSKSKIPSSSNPGQETTSIIDTKLDAKQQTPQKYDTVKLIAVDEGDLHHAKSLFASHLSSYDTKRSLTRLTTTTVGKSTNHAIIRLPDATTPMPHQSDVEFYRETLFTEQSTAISITKQDNILYKVLKQSVLKGHETHTVDIIQTAFQAGVPSDMLSVNFGLHTRLSQGADLKHDELFPKQLTGAQTDPSSSKFVASTPNAPSLIRDLEVLKEQYTASQVVKLRLVPDFKIAQTKSGLPILEMTFEVAQGKASFIGIKSISQELIHDIMLPEYPIDLSFCYTSSDTSFGYNEENGADISPWQSFIKETIENIEKGQDIRRMTGLTISYPAKKQRDKAKTDSADSPSNVVSYIIRDVSMEEFTTFQIPARQADGTKSSEHLEAKLTISSSNASAKPQQLLSLSLPVHEKISPSKTKSKTKPVSHMDLDSNAGVGDPSSVEQSAREELTNKEKQKLFISTTLWLAQKFKDRAVAKFIHSNDLTGEN